MGERARRPADVFGRPSADGQSGRVGLRHRERDKLSSRVKTHLLADVLAVIVDREDAQVQRLGDLPAGLPLTNLLQHFHFPSREWVVGLHSEGLQSSPRGRNDLKGVNPQL